MFRDLKKNNEMSLINVVFKMVKSSNHVQNDSYMLLLQCKMIVSLRGY